jgi:hypothetical protein
LSIPEEEPLVSTAVALKILALSVLVWAFVIGLSVGQLSKSSDKVPTIYVVNESTYVTDAEVKNDLPAFQAALDKDFYPYWNVTAKLVFAAKAPPNSIYMTLEDKSDVEGALAYHSKANGLPYSRVFVGTSKFYDFSWTVGFTHELFEMLVDPGTSRVEQGDFNTVLWFGEVCDPVESDEDGYNRPGADGSPVLISDFITEAWFGAETVGPIDFTNTIFAPGEIAPGGYAQYWDGLHWDVVDNFRKGHPSDRGFIRAEDLERD